MQKTGTRAVRRDFLTQDDRQQIHDAAVRLLETTGAKFENNEALNYLEESGAIVDRTTQIVKFPRQMVEDAMAKIPESFVMEGRDRKYDVCVGGGETSFIPTAIAVYVNDLETGEYRLSTSEDMKKIAILTDKLEEFNFTYNSVTNNDLNPAVDLVHSLEINMNNTTKPIMCGMVSGEAAEQYIQMGSVLVGGRENLKNHLILMGGACAVSPLTYPTDVLESIMAFAKVGLPVRILSMALAGATSPMSMAGTLALQNAELLAGFVLLQTITPGLPCVYATSSTLMDLRLCVATLGCAEMSMFSACTAEMARFYNMPSFVAGS